MSEQQPQINVPSFCHRHLRELVVWELSLMPDQTWRAHVVVAQILMFQAAAASDRVQEQSAGDAHALSGVLANLGCLACAFPDSFKRAVTVLRKGLSHAAAVSKNELQDPDWGDWGHAPKVAP